MRQTLYLVRCRVSNLTLNLDDGRYGQFDKVDSEGCQIGTPQEIWCPKASRLSIWSPFVDILRL